MRLGKRKEKEKDPAEVKSQGVDGITRLICLSKGQNPLKGTELLNLLYLIVTYICDGLQSQNITKSNSTF